MVMKTWGPLVPHLELISDSVEEKFKTKVLPYTINTENGHCNKTMAILEYFDQLESSPSFLVIVDDDTIFSVVRLAQLLGCYDKTESFLLGRPCSCHCMTVRISKYVVQGRGTATWRPSQATTTSRGEEEWFSAGRQSPASSSQEPVTAPPLTVLTTCTLGGKNIQCPGTELFR